MNSKFLMVEEENVGNDTHFQWKNSHPFWQFIEPKILIMPLKTAKAILDNQGKGHSCSIHSQNQDNIKRLGSELPVCRIIVNQAHCFATGGNFDNGLAVFIVDGLWNMG